jgi:glycosyltransferase involved in cell wall biosynthesis
MPSFAVIVTAHNDAAVLARTLRSVTDALACHAAATPDFRAGDAQVVLVDDGSTDGTAALLGDWAAGQPQCLVVRRDRPSSPGAARNAGVAASSGELLFFLDGDDLFLGEHMLRCTQALQDPGCCFAKTGVRLKNPVHPDWRPRIEHSVVINLCVRRRCHDAVGGFPDYHLFARHGDGFAPVADIFFKLEDQFYNELVCSLFPGVKVAVETVEHLRYPGNSFDRQYAKFCRPFGQYREELPADYCLRLRLAEVITAHRLEVLRHKQRDHGLHG